MSQVDLSGIAHHQIHRGGGHGPDATHDYDMEDKPAGYPTGDGKGEDEQ
jgi:hypothetical protein